MHFRHSIYVPFAVATVAASGAVPPHSEHAVRAVPDNVATPMHNTLRVRQDDPADAESGDCKDPSKELFWCFMCGGKGDDGKCKGVTDDVVTDLWKGCTCKDDPNWDINPPALNRPDYPEHQKAIKEHHNLKEDTAPLPGPAKQNKVLQILADWNKDPKSLEDYSKVNWLFWTTDIGTAPDCRQDPLTSREDTVDILNDPDHTFFPGGTFDLQMPGFEEKCQYKNDGASVGKLFCPGQEINCVDDPHDKNPSDPNAEKGNYECGDKLRQPVFLCEY